MTPELRTFFVSVISEDTPPGTVSGHIGTVIAPSVKAAAGMYVIQTQAPAMFVDGVNVELRVQGEGKPNYERVTCWSEKGVIHARVHGPDSASDAIENMMEPRPPIVNEVSEAGTMTNFEKKREVYVDPDLRVDSPIVPFEPPHPWMVFRVFYGNEEDPILVVDVSFEGALKKAEAVGLEVKAISLVDFVGGVERVDLF